MNKRKLLPISLVVMTTLSAQAIAADKNMNEVYKYQIGGGSPIAQSGSGAVNIGSIGAGVEWNSSMECGAFDMNTAITKSFQFGGNFQKTIDQLTNNLTQAAAGLAGAALQRANPQLFEMLMQGGESAQFDLDSFNTSCESIQNQMLDMLPDSSYTAMNFGDVWKSEFQDAVSDPNKSVFDNKANVMDEVKKMGLKSIEGTQKGGEHQAPYEPVSEAVIAGFNASFGRNSDNTNPITNAGSGIGSATGSTPLNGSSPAITNMPEDFKSPADVNKFVKEAFGTRQIMTCEGCSSSSTMGVGLTPELVALTDKAKADIDSVFAKSTISGAANAITDADLEKISQPPTIMITKDVIYSLQQESDSAQAAFKSRMAAELATLRLFDKLSAARRILYAGMFYPDLNANTSAKDTVKEQIEAIDSHIRMMRDEIEIRQMLASNVPVTLLQRQAIRDQQGVSTSTKGGLYNE
ncbi:hypothetical protein [Motilimonas cestriensis]|uniref:hypothetical protein n=1 Tax=Motilimonas cestriensis TaxID=2742685 RepID=UPI003DA28EEB